MNKKIKRYVECYIETETCNLRCHYCYINIQNKFNNKIVDFRRSPQEIAQALSRKRLGGTCLINLCAGGETLLADSVIDVVYELLKEGHYVMVVTNGTLTERFKKIQKFPKEFMGKLIFKFSFHYLEMKRLGWIDRFFENVTMMKDAGASFTVEVTPNDELIPYKDELKTICMEKLGTLCHLTIARDDRTSGIDVLTEMGWDEYKKVWGEFKSALFDFKTQIFYKKRKEFCYAGEWSIYVNLMSGSMKQCYFGKEIDNIYDNIKRKLKFKAIGHKCELPHCYNGHAFLTLGVIPELETIDYASLRNRVDNNGDEWLKPEMKEFLSHKLKENNEEYGWIKKLRTKNN